MACLSSKWTAKIRYKHILHFGDYEKETNHKKNFLWGKIVVRLLTTSISIPPYTFIHLHIQWLVCRNTNVWMFDCICIRICICLLSCFSLTRRWIGCTWKFQRILINCLILPNMVWFGEHFCHRSVQQTYILIYIVFIRCACWH